MNKPMQLNILYVDKLRSMSPETVRPTGFEEMGGVLKVCYHRVNNGIAQDMAKFMPVEDFLACYEPLPRAPWIIHFFKQPGRQTVVSYDGKPVGHLSHLDVLYTREGSPRIFMQVEAPCVAIEDEADPRASYQVWKNGPGPIELPKCSICGCTDGTCPHLRAITQIPDTPIPAVQFVQEPADRGVIEAVSDMAREVLAESKGRDVPAIKIQIGDLVLLMTKLPQADSEGNLTSFSQTYQIAEKNVLDTGYAMTHVELIFVSGGKVVLPASVPLYCIRGDEDATHRPEP